MRTVQGFEDVWRPPVRARAVRPRSVLSPSRPAPTPLRSRLTRLVRRAPEVMVKVTGRTRDAAHLKAHLTYITRNGALEGESRDGFPWRGREDVDGTAEAWAWAAHVERRRRDAPLSLSLMLSMPAGTDALRLNDAARAFAQDAFGGRHDYVLVLHTDTPHPHVHLTVEARAEDGRRLTPKKADLELWRQLFARALRERGIEAEATPRRARGVTRKAERGMVRRMRERNLAGAGPVSRVARGALVEAAAIAGGGPPRATAWEEQILRRQAAIRGMYLAQADLLARSPEPDDRALADAVRAFVGRMPAPDTHRLALARALRDRRADPARGPSPPGGRER